MKNTKKNEHLKQNIKKCIVEILSSFNIKITDGTKDTPDRVSNMLVNELFIGLQQEKFPKYKMFKIDNLEDTDIICVENIDIFSICEHHFLPFIGKATFKYKPKDKVIGLSKIPRIIDFLSRKPNLQERLTIEIFNTFKKILNTEDIYIEIKCEHFCTKIRGIKENTIMTTKKQGGIFKNNIN